MAITRPTATDDSGDLTSGTILNNAWLQTQLLDPLDARWSRVTITATGTVNDLDISEADYVVFNNPSDLTVTGVLAPSSPSKPGKPWRFRSFGAGNVFFKHEGTGSSALNRFKNFLTTADTPVGAGVGTGIYVYDDVQGRWVLVSHEQGTQIPWTPTDASGASLSLTVTAARYLIHGRQVLASFNVTYPTTADGSQAKIGGLPVTCNANINGAVAIGASTVGSGFTLDVFAGAATVRAWNLSGTALANSALSGKNLQATAIYQGS